MPFPDSIKNAPELQAGLNLYLAGFQELRAGLSDTSRLTWDLIDRWCTSYDIFGETRELCFTYFRALDNELSVFKDKKSKISEGSKPDVPQQVQPKNVRTVQKNRR